MYLILVESPTKSKTLGRFLGKEYQVLATYGHVRDLPKGEFGIDVEKNFEPKYVIPLRARKTIKLLKEAVAKADTTILATDEDREGEAIAWHLSYVLKLKNPKRIVFHEITKSAIEEALKNPRDIDIDLVDSQQARRILDRIVGYKLSPFLWKKVARGLSAGRVQSVAVRLVVEREREIKNFKPEEYWTIMAFLKKIKGSPIFEALLAKKDGKTIEKLEIKNKDEAEKILKELENAEYEISDIEKKEINRNPLSPFTTSTLQQEAWKKFRFPAKFTMQIAQHLYERGLTTYHRTDSLNLSSLSLSAAKKFIAKKFGQNYWAGFPRRFKTKSKGAQEAHEAIRPTYADQDPERIRAKSRLDDNHYKLYDLIWRRFIASQMAKAIFDSTSVDIEATPKENLRLPTGRENYTFRVSGQLLRFDGFLKIYPIKFDEKELPPLQKKEILELVRLSSDQHFTQPPARYTEASLIKTLEENGIGRPSTYAPIISTVQERNYIEKNEEKRFQPTEIGTVVNDLLVAHFPEVVDINFTANLEKDLDKIAENKEEWVPTIKKFYEPFAENLKQKYEKVSKKEFTEKKTEKICPECGSPILIRLGKFGEFYACSAFPKCKYTEPLKENKPLMECPKCSMRIARPSPYGSGYANAPMQIKGGEIVEKRTKKGKIFYGCTNYPNCDFALWDKPCTEMVQGKPTPQFCPKCGSLLVETKRKQIKCSNKECDFKVEK